MIKLGWGNIHQGLCHRHRRLIRTVKEVVVERQFMQLFINRVKDFGLTISQVAAPEPRHTIQNLVTVGIVDVDMLRTRNNPSTRLLILFNIRKRM